MVILVSGDRNWSDPSLIFEVLDKAHTEWHIDVLKSGGARGADTIAATWARSRKVMLREYPADWKNYRKSAGPIRNRQMLKENEPVDLVVAFHDDLEHSKGTADMIRAAKTAGVCHQIVCHA